MIPTSFLLDVIFTQSGMEKKIRIKKINICDICDFLFDLSLFINFFCENTLDARAILILFFSINLHYLQGVLTII